MYDDSVITLIDVRHVPKSKKNLISLRMLDSNECTYKVGSTILMIAHSVIVVKKIPTMGNPINIRIKYVPTVNFKYCLDLISVSSI